MQPTNGKREREKQQQKSKKKINSQLKKWQKKSQALEHGIKQLRTPQNQKKLNRRCTKSAKDPNRGFLGRSRRAGSENELKPVEKLEFFGAIWRGVSTTAEIGGVKWEGRRSEKQMRCVKKSNFVEEFWAVGLEDRKRFPLIAGIWRQWRGPGRAWWTGVGPMWCYWEKNHGNKFNFK